MPSIGDIGRIEEVRALVHETLSVDVDHHGVRICIDVGLAAFDQRRTGVENGRVKIAPITDALSTSL